MGQINRARKTSKNGVVLSANAAVFDEEFLAEETVAAAPLTELGEMVAAAFESHPEYQEGGLWENTVDPVTQEVATPEPQRTIKDAVTAELPEGCYVSKGYLYTPEIGGKPRWFDLKLADVEVTEDGTPLRVTASRASMKARGLV